MFWDGKCDQIHFENWIQLHCTIIDALRFDYIIDSFIFEFLRLKFLFTWIRFVSFLLSSFGFPLSLLYFIVFSSSSTFDIYLKSLAVCVCVWMWVCFFSLGNPPGWNAAFCDLYGTKRLIIPYKKQTWTRLIKMRRKNYSKFISNLFTTFSLSLLSRMVQVIWVKFQWKL